MSQLDPDKKRPSLGSLNTFIRPTFAPSLRTSPRLFEDWIPPCLPKLQRGLKASRDFSLTPALVWPTKDSAPWRARDVFPSAVCWSGFTELSAVSRAGVLDSSRALSTEVSSLDDLMNTVQRCSYACLSRGVRRESPLILIVCASRSNNLKYINLSRCWTKPSCTASSNIRSIRP